jgi:hypothetical protein
MLVRGCLLTKLVQPLTSGKFHEVNAPPTSCTTVFLLVAAFDSENVWLWIACSSTLMYEEARNILEQRSGKHEFDALARRMAQQIDDWTYL